MINLNKQEIAIEIMALCLTSKPINRETRKATFSYFIRDFKLKQSTVKKEQKWEKKKNIISDMDLCLNYPNFDTVICRNWNKEMPIIMDESQSFRIMEMNWERLREVMES